MTLFGLLLRSLWHFRRTNLGVVLGVAVATTVITGALIVGDSLRYTLGRTADQRLGSSSYALIGGDRFFTTDLANRLAPGSSGVIVIEGVASTPDGERRANHIALIGIDPAFAEMMGLPRVPAPGAAFPSRAVSEQLGVTPGDEIIIRVSRPSALPTDAALVDASQPPLALRVEVVDGGVTDVNGGRFSLRAEQRPPLNLFVHRDWLATQLEQPGRANLALSRTPIEAFEPTLSDLSLELIPRPSGQELVTPRVFIDASIEEGLAELPGTRILTYMVNTVSLGDKQSPYAMVAASNKLGGLELADDEIAINAWLAEDIGAAVGDTLTLTYYLPDEGDRLVEGSTTLTVARIVEIEGGFADPALTPDFPGLAEAEALRGWDAGPAIDRGRIRDKDEEYWDDHRATPKAFVNLETGQRLWSNRFGTLTAIRFAGDVSEADLTEHIDAGKLGLSPINVREQALAAAAGTVDFGQLFLSLSGFIIIAGMVLTATLFAMSVEQRARQLGVVMAMGLSRGQVARLVIGEGAVLALAGACLGLGGAFAYAHGVVAALTGEWSGAVADSAVSVHLRPGTLVIGPVGAAAVSLVTMALGLMSLLRRPAQELLRGAVGRVSGRPKAPIWLVIATAVMLIIVGLICLSSARQATGMRAALLGFGCGAACLALLLLAFYFVMILRIHRDQPPPARITMTRLAAFNLIRRRGRSLAAVVTLSCGVFLVVAVSGFRLSSEIDTHNRQAGTGGFATIVESTQPIRYDLNTQLGRDHYFLDASDLPPGSVVAFRVNNGDDASCLNLNKTSRPRLLGVDPMQLSDRRAFPFTSHQDPREAWRLLQPATRGSGRPVPVIADANTAQWALKLPVGGTMALTDEAGRPFDVQLVATLDNTILQGSLVMDEETFERLFPTTSGHRLLLIDAEGDEQRTRRADLLQEAMVDEGLTITPTTDRLAQYNQVQNTYLTIFQALGGLGVVLGSLGLGVIAARNLIERRSELALLSAVGVSRRRIFIIQLIEHGQLLCLGLAFGVLAAAIPASQQGPLLGTAWRSSLAAIGATLAAGLMAIVLGLRSAGKGRLTEALRRD
ncbi:FtsX-like permease family protein [Phycisphaeraceae bacterium D3-23]